MRAIDQPWAEMESRKLLIRLCTESLSEYRSCCRRVELAPTRRLRREQARQADAFRDEALTYAILALISEKP